MRRLTLMLLVAASFSAVCWAESQVAGDWQGTLRAGGAEFRLVLHITAKDGNLAATLDSLDQGANGIPVNAVTLKDSKLSLTINAINGNYSGVVNKEATQIAGTWSQGQPMKLDFERAPARAAASVSAPAAKPTLDGLDEFITQTMKDWKVPGLAIAVVQGDKVTLLKGYGYRDLEKQLPVTPNTLFAIGSITKSFTVTTLGMEMDEGKVDWDKPVRDYLPSFKLYEPSLTEQMTIRDLITHRSGLPRHDLVWYTSDFPREEILRRLQFLEPSKPWRSTFQYNNLMFMAAGYIAGQLNGSGWEDTVTQRIFKPLEMTGTNFSEQETQNSADFG
ncbi:MAG TPA: serine hydrolase domain-containing protein, partial [Bryobacteraceae bacterium]|nr:serine hydrolase domain-containing protein [Bryobacteraceae bacterium]